MGTRLSSCLSAIALLTAGVCMAQDAPPAGAPDSGPDERGALSQSAPDGAPLPEFADAQQNQPPLPPPPADQRGGFAPQGGPNDGNGPGGPGRGRRRGPQQQNDMRRGPQDQGGPGGPPTTNRGPQQPGPGADGFRPMPPQGGPGSMTQPNPRARGPFNPMPGQRGPGPMGAGPGGPPAAGNVEPQRMMQQLQRLEQQIQQLQKEQQKLQQQLQHQQQGQAQGPSPRRFDFRQFFGRRDGNGGGGSDRGNFGPANNRRSRMNNDQHQGPPNRHRGFGPPQGPGFGPQQGGGFGQQQGSGFGPPPPPPGPMFGRRGFGPTPQQQQQQQRPGFQGPGRGPGSMGGWGPPRGPQQQFGPPQGGGMQQGGGGGFGSQGGWGPRAEALQDDENDALPPVTF